MTGIVRDITKAVKKFVKGAKKVFKKITESNLGKALLSGATIWLGGAALGAWNLPGWVPGATKINGAFAGGAKTGATAAAGTSTTGAAPAVASAGNAQTAAGLTSAPLAPPAGIETITVTGARPAATSIMGVKTGAATAGTAAATTVPAPAMKPVDLSGVQGTAEHAATLTGKEAPGGLISKLMKPVAKMATWATENPIPATMLVSGLGSAMSPDAIDVERERQDREDEDRRRWEENLQVGNIDLGFRRSDQPLRYASGENVFSPSGAINRVRRV